MSLVTPFFGRGFFCGRIKALQSDMENIVGGLFGFDVVCNACPSLRLNHRQLIGIHSLIWATTGRNPRACQQSCPQEMDFLQIPRSPRFRDVSHPGRPAPRRPVPSHHRNGHVASDQAEMPASSTGVSGYSSLQMPLDLSSALRSSSQLWGCGQIEYPNAKNTLAAPLPQKC